MKGEGHGQANQLHDINWGTHNHASSVPQLMSCNYYIFVCMYVSVNACVGAWTYYNRLAIISN